MLVTRTVAGDGLTVIAKASNPAGVALLRHEFNDELIRTAGLLLGTLPPTAIAALFFFM